MDPVDRLKQKLRAIEALYAGATTPGERDAAGAARERIRARIATLAAEAPVEFRFTGLDPWNASLFVALARRYGLEPYRYRGQRRTTLVVKAPEPFVRDVFEPEFQRMSQALVEHLSEHAARIIAEVLESDPRATEP